MVTLVIFAKNKKKQKEKYKTLSFFHRKWCHEGLRSARKGNDEEVVQQKENL